MLWLIFLINNKKSSCWFLFIYERTWNEDKIYIKYIITCEIFFQPTTGSRETKFDRTNCCLFDFIGPLRCLMSQNAPPDSWSYLGAFFTLARERVTTQSSGKLGSAVIGCLHKQKDPIKPKDPVCVLICPKSLGKTWDGQELNFISHIRRKLKYRGWYKHFQLWKRVLKG